MKIIAFALLTIVASATALSDVSDSEFQNQKIPDSVINAVELVKQWIEERGLDPYEVEKAEASYVLITPLLFSASGRIEDFRFSGLSNIVVKDIAFNVISSKLIFDIELPQVLVTIGDSAAKVSVFGRGIDGQLSGRLAINGLGLSGEAVVSISSDSKVTVSGVRVFAKLRSIESALTINILGINLSRFVNIWLTNLPGNLSIYSTLINDALARIITFLLNFRH